jgi:hypothetical protein
MSKYGGHAGKGGRLFLIFHFDDFASLVITALGARAMRHLRLMTIGALRSRVRSEKVMRAPGRRTPLGMSPFRICHDYLNLYF